MARSLIALWTALLVATTAISGLAWAWQRQVSKNSQQRVEEILQAQLSPIDRSIAGVIEQYEIDLQGLRNRHQLSSSAGCIELARSPLARSVVVVNANDKLHYPERVIGMSTDQATLVDEARQLLIEQRSSGRYALGPNQVAVPSQASAALQQSSAPDNRLSSRSYTSNRAASAKEQKSSDSLLASKLKRKGDTNASENQVELQRGSDAAPILTESTEGWITWYHRRNMVLGYWWTEGDFSAMIALPSGRWKADIVSALPDTGRVSKGSLATSLNTALHQLVDVEGELIYQWSGAPQSQWEQLVARPIAAQIPVSDPFEGWRLRIYADERLTSLLAGNSYRWLVALTVGSVTVALLLMGVVLTMSLSRQIRLAQQRVSFVNQVSHELRTPLTNICMFADLLSDSLKSEPNVEQYTEKVSVIQNESQRLSRLIANVLQFARPESKELKRTLEPVDAVVAEVVDTFLPRLNELGIVVDLDLNTPEIRECAPDAIEQILVNLVGNAEKYASDGKLLTIRSSAAGPLVTLEIVDAGPGIPRKQRDQVFDPFFRLSDRLIDPAGTGIGLTIVRELARKHGGDCWLAESEQGARFVCTLLAPVHTPPN